MIRDLAGMGGLNADWLYGSAERTHGGPEQTTNPVNHSPISPQTLSYTVFPGVHSPRLERGTF